MVRSKIVIPVAVSFFALGIASVTLPTFGQGGLDTVMKRDAQFIPLYHDYIDQVNKHGANGIRQVAATDIHLQDNGTTIRGDKAIGELAHGYDGLQKNLNHTMRYEPAKVTDQFAILYAEEKISYDEGAANGDDPAVVTITWWWKHCWRKTPQGWKLVSIARDFRSDKERKADSGMWYTVGIKAEPDTTPAPIKKKTR